MNPRRYDVRAAREIAFQLSGSWSDGRVGC
jgi:hypothetical protein